jgi:NADP-dependent 3-hydroxy acid dehydrogenase YdfG
MTQNVEGKVVVLITGASIGLGEATAQHLAAADAKLVLGARRLDRLQAFAGELALGTDAAMQTDVTDREQVKALVDHAVTMHGHLDVIVNNAGLTPHSLARACIIIGAASRRRRAYRLWKRRRMCAGR